MGREVVVEVEGSELHRRMSHAADEVWLTWPGRCLGSH